MCGSRDDHQRLRAHRSHRRLGNTDLHLQQEFTFEVDEEGTGYVYNNDLAGGSCTVSPCVTGGTQENWLVQVSKMHGVNLAQTHMNFCLQGVGAIGVLRGEFTFTTTEVGGAAANRTVLEQSPAPGGMTPRFEVTGTWIFEEHKYGFVFP